MATRNASGSTQTALSQRIRTLRHAAGAKQEEIAAAATIKVNTLQGYESGRSAPSLGRIVNIAAALRVPLDALFCPDGWAVLPTPWLRPETLASLSDPVAFEACHRAICERMREALEQAKPLLPVAPGRQRRTRQQLLAAQAVRLAALSARGNRKPPRELT